MVLMREETERSKIQVRGDTAKESDSNETRERGPAKP
jgi:hypothetical protein